MSGQPKPMVFEQVHVDVARNATDDFNPFHDPLRSHRIYRNPFPGPIVLGFQLECLCEYLLDRERSATHGERFPSVANYPYSNFQFTFAGALLPGQPFRVYIKRGKNKDRPRDRMVVRKANGTVVVLGSQHETAVPAFLDDLRLPDIPTLSAMPDRSLIEGTTYFLKRKFIGTANGKNFVLSALANQSYYFDELSERVRFPAIFPVALTSNALLEMAWSEGYDFEADPMVYTSHHISVDRRLQAALRSNAVVHLLVNRSTVAGPNKTLGTGRIAQFAYHCFGMLETNVILFRAVVQTAPLQHILMDSDTA